MIFAILVCCSRTMNDMIYMGITRKTSQVEIEGFERKERSY